jgi:1,4-dihydroxy-2-naphthoate octaprenyltransferase
MRRVLAATFVATAVGLAAVGALAPWSAVSMLGLVAAVDPVGRVIRGAAGRDLVPVLEGTARVQILVGALLAAGLSI